MRRLGSGMSVARRLLLIDGCQSELISVHPLQGDSPIKLQVLVIPGNPGAAGYYVPFMLALRNLFKGTAEISSLSQLGHGYDHGTKLFSLKEQVEHKAAFVREQMFGPGRPPVALIGHSIGAYMAVQAAKLLEAKRAASNQISKVAAVFPFLSVDPHSIRQRFLKAGTLWPPALGLLLGTLGCVPLSLQRGFINFASGGMDKHSVEATMALLRYYTGKSIAYLGHTEFQDLASTADWDALGKLGERCVVTYAANDTWFPPPHLEEMKRRLPDLQIFEPIGLRHGFCCSVKQSESLAQLLYPTLCQGL